MTSKEYRQSHKEEISEYQRKYYQSHKAVILERVRKYQQSRRTEIAKYQREYRQSHKIEITEQKRAYFQTPAGRESQRRGGRNSRERYPEKAKARSNISNAIKLGKIERSVFCEECGLPAKTEGHHPDYSKPLEVIWLCPECHVELNKSNF